MRRRGRGISGPQPRLPARLVERPDRRDALVQALCSRDRLLAVTGIAGAGKSILARQACAIRQVQRTFRDGIAWLEAGPGRPPLVLLADLADSLELPNVTADFSTEEQGRDQLVAALRGKRVLIVLDDVREPGQLDALTGLAPRCSLLFITRLDKLADAVKARAVTVGELAADEALKVLGRWTDQDPDALPYGAGDLCAQAGNLALGVALAGAMAAQGKPITKVLASLKVPPGQRGDRDPAPVGEPAEHPATGPPGPGGDPLPAPGTLLNVIRASIAELPEADQERYAQLAVFARYGPFPRDAARALWPPDLPDTGVADLLASLTGRSLLMAAGEGWYTAHDLQYDALERRLGAAGLAAAHARLLASYRLRYPGGWAESAGDPYLARALAGHLHDAQLGDELRTVLTDTAWIQARLTHGQLPGLISDYSYAEDSLTRLMGQPDVGITAWAAGLTGPTLAEAEVSAPADAEPALANAEPAPADAVADSPAEAEFAVHEPPEPAPVPADYTGWAFSVAITPDGSRAVCGGDDGSVRVWDLAAGQTLATLTGHTRPVWSVAVTPDGSRAVSGSSDGSVRVWDLVIGREDATLTGHTRPVWSVAVTPDGNRAVSGSSDGSVRVWDLAAGRELAILTGQDRAVFSVAITSDGTRAVSGSGSDVQVWDLTSRRVRATLTGHTGEVWSVAVTPDGGRAVSGSSDGSVRVWDLASRRARATLTGGIGQVFAVAITPDKTMAVGGGEDGSVQVWDVTSRTELARWTGKQPVVGCTVLPGSPPRIGVGQRKGPPFLLDLLGPPESEPPEEQDRRGARQGERRGDKARTGARRRPGHRVRGP